MSDSRAKAWSRVGSLFAEDAGMGFPDIWLSGLRDEEVAPLFEWLLSQCMPGLDGRVDCYERAGQAVLRDLVRPNQGYEDFSKELTGLRVAGTELLGLHLCSTAGALSLEYAPGKDWNEPRFYALLDLLQAIRARHPQVHFSLTHEGSHRPQEAFADAVEACMSAGRRT